MWAPEACLLARRSAEIIYKAFQDPSDPSGSAKMAHRATNLSYFTIIRHCHESPSHSIFGADGAKKQVAMEQPPVGAHGSRGAGDPGPAPNQSFFRQNEDTIQESPQKGDNCTNSHMPRK